ncbi:MAG: hypothetical protein SGJ27_04055 [Candidatus Melainabacteria bacterium]|nr:hypothetical protein [Candidatus Melainabacteria bacterium]
MVMRRSGIPALSIALATLLISAGATFAQESDDKDKESTKPLSIEEMRAHRQTMRSDLMLPSLKGIRGLAYGIAGTYPEGSELNKAMENRLGQLSIKIKKYEELEPGITKPIDGVLQMKCLRTGSNSALVEIFLVQWATLDRDPKTGVRAITYTDQAVCGRHNVKETAIHLLNQFIIDFQKANALSAQPETTAPEQQVSEKPSKKKKKSQE